MPRERVLSFKYAFEGIITAFKDEPNFKLHFFIGIAVVIAGLFFGITKAEWLTLILTIGFVFAFELTNTAIEEIVDSFTDQVHPSAKKAKDIAASAVLFSAITAFIVGIIIFLPYILRVFLK